MDLKFPNPPKTQLGPRHGPKIGEVCDWLAPLCKSEYINVLQPMRFGVEVDHPRRVAGPRPQWPKNLHGHRRYWTWQVAGLAPKLWYSRAWWLLGVTR